MNHAESTKIFVVLFDKLAFMDSGKLFKFHLKIQTANRTDFNHLVWVCHGWGRRGLTPPPLPICKSQGRSYTKIRWVGGQTVDYHQTKNCAPQAQFFWHVIEIIGRKSLELTIIRPKFPNISVVLKKKAP